METTTEKLPSKTPLPLTKGFFLDGWYVEPELNRLSHGGDTFRVHGKFMDVLVCLAERDGMVSRQELFDEVWPDTVVVEECLTRAVSELRKTLGDDPRHPRYIETIPKKGYRLIAPVIPAQPEASEDKKKTEPAESSELQMGKSSTRRYFWLLGPAILAGVVLLVVAQLIGASRPQVSQGSVVNQLTSLPGRETHPALSPTGDRLAFAWEGGKENAGRTAIYVKVVGADEPMCLTPQNGFHTHPAWSHDARFVAYVKVGLDRTDIFQVPATGGQEQLLVPGDGKEFTLPMNPEFSPDGRWLAFSAATKDSQGAPGVILRDLDTGIDTQLTNPGQQPWLDLGPRFSNDSQKIAFMRTRGDGVSIAVVSRDGVEIVTIPLGDRVISDVVWDPTAKNNLLFADSDGLWRIGLENQIPQLITAGAGNNAKLAAAREGHLVAYVDASEDRDIWECDVSPGEAASQPRELIASSRQEVTASFSSDGRRIALISERSGEPQVWVCNADGSNMAQLTNYAGTAIQRPKWSPDGRTIAYTAFVDAQSKLCLIDVASRKTRILSPPGAHEVAPNWSKDGKWIYVSVQTEKYWRLLKRSFATGEAVLVTTNGFGAVESPDSTRVFYSRIEGDMSKICSIPIDGGPEELMYERPLAEAVGWDIRDEGFYYAFRSGKKRNEFGLMLRNLDSGREDVLLTVVGSPGFQCDISPDGKKVIFDRVVRAESDIIGLKLM
jgi:Tol biopolymer transport system component/DNA-binding winged helix-turn-helix (wHTH) protein